MIFFTSDTHFGHDKEFIYGSRGYSSMREHDEDIIRRWNETVGPDDEVYHLGDVIMGADREYGLDCIERLNGHIHILIGNHDSAPRVELYASARNVADCSKYADICRYGDYQLYLSHYPVMVNNDADNSGRPNRMFCLHGHTHDTEIFQFPEFHCINVALDARDMRPVRIDDVIEDCRHILGNKKA